MKFPICNHRPERAPQIKGHTFFLCWRCTGITFGAVCMLLICKLFNVHFFAENFVIAVAIMFPMLCDGIMQYGYSVTSNNSRRFVTGTLFGMGLVYAIAFWIADFDSLENHTVLISSLISISGYFMIFICIKFELRKVLKEKLAEEQMATYIECYRRISPIGRNCELNFNEEYYNNFHECTAELSLFASSNVISAFSDLEKIVVGGYEKYREFINQNDPHACVYNYEFIGQGGDEEPIEFYRGTEKDDKVFDSKLCRYIEENTPSQNEINRILRDILNAMRMDIGNSRIK